MEIAVKRERQDMTPESLANLMPFARPILSPSTGALRDELIIYDEVETLSDTGDPNIDYVEIEKVRAKLTPLSGFERYYANQLGHEVSHRIQMRWNTNINTSRTLSHYDRALKKVRNFEIVYAMDVQNRHTQWDIFAHEVVD